MLERYIEHRATESELNWISITIGMIKDFENQAISVLRKQEELRVELNSLAVKISTLKSAIEDYKVLHKIKE